MRLLFEKTLTFYNINDTEAKQRRYMIGSGCVNSNGPTHAVSNNHDGRRVLSIDRLHHFANIPFERKSKDNLLTLLHFYHVCQCFWVYSQKLLTVLEACRIITVYIVQVCMWFSQTPVCLRCTHSNLLGHRVCWEIIRIFHFGVTCRWGKRSTFHQFSPSKLLNKPRVSCQMKFIITWCGESWLLITGGSGCDQATLMQQLHFLIIFATGTSIWTIKSDSKITLFPKS